MAPASYGIHSSGRIGTYGCCVGNGRVVRVGLVEDAETPPRAIAVDSCPACGNPHTHLKPTWRKPTERDEGREVEVVIDADGASVPSSTGP